MSMPPPGDSGGASWITGLAAMPAASLTGLMSPTGDGEATGEVRGSCCGEVGVYTGEVGAYPGLAGVYAGLVAAEVRSFPPTLKPLGIVGEYIGLYGLVGMLSKSAAGLVVVLSARLECRGDTGEFACE